MENSVVRKIFQICSFNCNNDQSIRLFNELMHLLDMTIDENICEF